MSKRDLEKEKQLELAAIWGSEVVGDSRFPKRKGAANKVLPVIDEDVPAEADVDVPSDVESVASSFTNDRVARKRKLAKKEPKLYRLHCFVAPGTERNAVRTVFEAYEPKVDIRTSQKGNLLNKTTYAVLTFRNKAMALHAVKMLDGTNQHDSLGVKELKLNMMLSRHQSKLVRMRTNRKFKKARETREADETKADLEFVQQFIKQHVKK